MIVLVDNKSYAKRLFETGAYDAYLEVDDEHGFDWIDKLIYKGYNFVTTGKHVEKFLDDYNIYYIHPEYKAKENFRNFVKRVNKMIKERQDIIKNTRGTERLVFGITSNGSEPSMYNSKVVFSIIKDTITGEYRTEYKFNRPFNELTRREKIDTLKSYLRKATEALGCACYGIEENDFSQNINYSTGKSVREVLAKFSMFVAVAENSTWF